MNKMYISFSALLNIPCTPYLPVIWELFYVHVFPLLWQLDYAILIQLSKQMAEDFKLLISGRWLQQVGCDPQLQPLSTVQQRIFGRKVGLSFPMSCCVAAFIFWLALEQREGCYGLC